MKLRRLFRTAFLFFLLSLLSVSVHGAAPGYLVEIRQDVALFSDIQPEFGRPIHEETGLYYIEDPAMLQELEESGLVESCYPNGMVYLHEEETNTRPADLTWVRSMLGYDYAAANGITGKGVRIAIIDTGLSNQFYDHTSATIEVGTNYRVAADHYNRHNTNDIYGHGTNVASIIADDLIGLAPEVTLIPLKCFTSSGASYDTIIEAIYDSVKDIHDAEGNVIDGDDDGYPDHYGCDILNLSFGSYENYPPLDEAIQYALSKGVIVVASAGNLPAGILSTGNDAFLYPAAQDGVIGVGSVDSKKQISHSSVQNKSVFLTAPGANIYGWSVKANDYDTDSGTSFSAPAVTAALALAHSIDPEMTAEQAANWLLQSAEDLGPEGYDTAYGYGLLNIRQLLHTIQTNHSENSTSIAVHHAPIDFDIFTACMAIYNSAGKLVDLRLTTTTKGSVLFRDIPLPDGGFYQILTMNDGFLPLMEARVQPKFD